jgi:hypothetical protein
VRRVGIGLAHDNRREVEVRQVAGERRVAEGLDWTPPGGAPDVEGTLDGLAATRAGRRLITARR